MGRTPGTGHHLPLLLLASLLSVHSAGAVVIRCGETLPGRVPVGGGSASFTFDAHANDAVSITLAKRGVETGSFDPQWSLLDPGGTAVTLRNGFDTCFDGQCESSPLPVSGTYTIRVFDFQGDGAGDVNLTLEAVSATFDGASNGAPSPVCGLPPDGTRAITCGDFLAGSIGDDFGDTDTFTFAAQTGEAVSITVAVDVPGAGSFDPEWVLFDPSGGRVVRCFATQCDSPPLPSSGLYTIEAFDLFADGTGSYRVALAPVSDTFGGASNGPPNPTCQRGLDGTQPLRCGQTLTGRIIDVGEADTFTFHAEAGDVASITLAPDATSRGSFDPEWALFDPAGSHLTLSNGFDRCFQNSCETQPLAAPGVYTVKVFDFFQDGAGTYDFTLEAVSGTFDGASNGPPTPVCRRDTDGTQALACGESRVGRIVPVGETDTFTFAAKSGDVMTVTVSETGTLTGSFDPGWTVFAPSGQKLTLANGLDRCVEGQCTTEPLPETGVYTVEVFDFLMDGTGDYTIALASQTTSCPCTDATSCDDANPCTADACDAGGTCQHTALADRTPCDDRNACTASERCTGGTCFGLPISCDDGNRCTTNSCDRFLGCQHTVIPACCGNGILEPGEACDLGVLNGAASCCSASCAIRPAGQVCRPQTNVCDAADACDGAGQACPPDGFAVDGTLCADGDPCTVEDVCQAGECTGGTRICQVTVQPFTKAARRSIPQIAVKCAAAESRRGGFCQAQGFPASALTPASAGSGDVAALGSETGCLRVPGTPPITTFVRRRLDRNGLAAFGLRLTEQGLRLLRQLAPDVLQVGVCVVVGTPNGEQVTLRRVVSVAAPQKRPRKKPAPKRRHPRARRAARRQ